LLVVFVCVFFYLFRNRWKGIEGKKKKKKKQAVRELGVAFQATRNWRCEGKNAIQVCTLKKMNDS